MYNDDKNDWSSESSPRILGMKIWQAALLVGMSVMDCLVLIIGAWIILSSSGPAAESAPALPTSTAGPTSLATASHPITPTLLPTVATASPEPLLPTYTPIGTVATPPTATASPTMDNGIPGWLKFEVEELELWLPESYAGGNPHTEAKAIMDSLKAKGAAYDLAELEAFLKSSSTNFVFRSFDSIQVNKDVVTEVSIIYDYADTEEPLSDYAARLIGNLAGGYEFLEERVIINKNYDIQQVIMVPKDPQGKDVRLVVYSVKDKDLVWIVLCATATEEMGTRLDTFDQMIKTLRILKPPK